MIVGAFKLPFGWSSAGKLTNPLHAGCQCHELGKRRFKHPIGSLSLPILQVQDGWYALLRFYLPLVMSLSLWIWCRVESLRTVHVSKAVAQALHGRAMVSRQSCLFLFGEMYIEQNALALHAGLRINPTIYHGSLAMFGPNVDLETMTITAAWPS